MSEEEKKAIKYLEFLSNEKCECEACQRAKKEYKIILNLLDELQKEIKEKTKFIKWVEKNAILKDKIKEKIKELEKDKDFDEDIYVEEFTVDILKELLEEN